MKLIVQKYGGSSLKNSHEIKQVAKQVAKIHKNGNQVIVIVSAMGKKTDELLNLAFEVSPHPSPRELDMLLSTGERQSMALLSMALHDLGCDSISLTGSQAGVLTDGSHREANIIDVKPIRVDEYLKQNKIVVLAGYQGVDPVTKEITTLGRGGSDITAVAFAQHYNALRCEIRKDVEGLYSADPHTYKSAKLVPEVSFDALVEMCLLGARILHPKAIQRASESSLPLHIGLSTKDEWGTLISPKAQVSELKALSINSHDNILKLNLISPKDTHKEKLTDFFEKSKLPCPSLLGEHSDSHNPCFYIHFFENIREALILELQSLPIVSVENKNLASVSISFNKEIPFQESLKILNEINTMPLEIHGHLQHNHSISFFVEPKHKESLIRILHEAYIG